jgi:hypothetical protein
MVENDPATARVLADGLAERPASRFDVTHVTRLADALAQVGETKFDAVLLDLDLPDSCNLGTYLRMSGAAPNVPVVVMTACDSQPLIDDLLRLGVQNYLVKDEITPAVLASVLACTVKHSQMLTRIQRQYDEVNAVLKAIKKGQVDSIVGSGISPTAFRIEAPTLFEEKEKLLKELALATRKLEQKNRRLSELYDMAQRFVNNASHEFRTPLTVISKFNSLVREGMAGDINDEQREYLDVVADCVDDLTIMVNDMLDISKLEAGMLGLRRKDCQLAHIVEHVRSRLDQKAKITNTAIEIAIPDRLPSIYCDAEKVGRVIVNLVVNGIKFTQQDGRIRLWAREDSANSQVIVGVTDNGRGISKDNLAVIFERFNQIAGDIRASTKGFGLGLSIVKELVHLNLGEINVESEVGVGSTFSFSIPIADTSSIITRYRGILERVLDSPSLMSLMTVEVNAEVDEDAADELDEFLHCVLRRNDLLLRTDRHAWLVAAEGGEQDRQLMVDKIHAAWKDENRNRTYGRLPQFTLEVSGTYHIGPHTASEPDAANPFPESALMPAKQRILVVDDDTRIARALSRRLKRLGYDTLTASDGKEGLESAIENHPDLIVLDIRMPIMDGLTVLEKLREREDTAAVPVVVVSASSADQKRALELGARCFLEKPYNPTVFTATIVAALNEVSEVEVTPA